MKYVILVMVFLSSTACMNKSIPIKEHTVLAVLWQQNAAEYRALSHQAFNTARMQLEQMVKSSASNKPLAIITDLDETILDNSPYSALLIDSDKGYEKSSWFEWGQKEAAGLVPGAEEFLNRAHQLGVEVFYISNRRVEQTTETLNNLKKFNLPNVDSSHLLLRVKDSSKRQRRQNITLTHDVVMLLGDNLSDFDEVFDDQTSAKRNELVEQNKQQFGTKFIVFPNPLYGDWETDGIYESQRLTEDEKRKVRNEKLRR